MTNIVKIVEQRTKEWFEELEKNLSSDQTMTTFEVDVPMPGASLRYWQICSGDHLFTIHIELTAEMNYFLQIIDSRVTLSHTHFFKQFYYEMADSEFPENMFQDILQNIP